MRFLLHLPAIAFLLTISEVTAAETDTATFLEAHCFECHDSESQKGKLDLTALSFDETNFETWVKIHDRVRSGEMPPAKKPRPEAAEMDATLATWATRLTAMDSARQQREGRSRLRRLNRVEFENSLRDLLAMPALKIKDDLPEDGTSHGFDRLAGALDMSFVHMESYLAAVDKALNDALCPFPEQPPVFKYRFKLTDNVRKNGKECEGSVGLAIGNKTAIALVGMERDETFVADSAHHLTDTEPFANAIGLFRHEDADYRWTMTAIQPVVTGFHKLRVSGYSFGWDGSKVIPTERHGALGWGVFSKGEHYGTVDLPPNKPAEREITAWLERGGGMLHGTDDNLRIIAASCENFRDYAHGKNKDVLGPMSPAPGVAVEWVEIEGPLYDMWPPANHRALFGDLAVKEWTEDSGVPQPKQQTWARGNPESFPKDIYGHRGEKRPVVYVESNAPEEDAKRLLSKFLRRALRRPVAEDEVSEYLAKVTKNLADGAAFQDAMLLAYREILTSPEFMLLREPVGELDDYALATRLSYFLWSTLPDEELGKLADAGKLSDPAILRAQTERMLNDKRAERFVKNFTGQWLALRQLNATQPDKKLYPEFMPWLSEAMQMESEAFFADLVKNDLSVKHFVKSDFAILNEPLAQLYGIDGVRGWDLRRVALPEGTVRGGFLTQAAVLKTTANGTTTSPVKRGAFVMEKILGIVPTPPPPDIGSIEPDVRGATTIREQLEKHRQNPSCAGCHAKMDPYGFALESFDVVGEWRGKYRVVGGEGSNEERKKVNGHAIEYHGGLPVDCTGQLPDGRPFDDVNALRTMLAGDPDRLAQAFLAQLATYATGASVSFADRAAIAAILEKTKADEHGLRSLIHELIQSELFRNK
ncbi:MAG: hypothetical protein ACI8UO_003209 [Verrucomicrobiales bacterium]|jgi:hypothetical protein